LPSKVTIPVRLELEYMLDQRRLFRHLQWYAVASISKFNDGRRQDSPGLQAFLRMSAPEILNENKLRRRLRQLASTLTADKLRELRALLGRGVRAPTPGLIDNWVDDQVLAIQATVQDWLTTATAAVAESGDDVSTMAASLTSVSKQLAQRAEARASFRILQLNSQIIQEVAMGAGSSHYRWLTERDDRVRPNHVALEGTVHAWSEPPSGGGTRPGEPGHPGSGYGCRCLPEPIAGPMPGLRA
jgi:hypothetical protein